MPLSDTHKGITIEAIVKWQHAHHDANLKYFEAALH